MATLLETIEEVTENIQDTSFTSTKLKLYINRALRLVAGTVPVPLPALETVGTVQTVLSTAYVAMPSTTGAAYQRNLDEYIYSTAQNSEFKTVPSLTVLQALYPNLATTGAVRHACLVGNVLWYQGIPGEVDTLRLRFFRFPTALDLDGDVPTCLPDHLHEDLLVNKATALAYSKIEDALEKAKLNTTFYDGEYQKAFSELKEWIGPERRRPIPVNDIMTSAFGAVAFRSDIFD